MSLTAAACECLGLLPSSLDTISCGDTLRFCLLCNLFCLSFWWMSCLPALPHTLENGGSRTLLNELQKRKQKAFVFLKQVFVLMGACSNVSTPRSSTHWIIKGEKVIWAERQASPRGFCELQAETPLTSFGVEFFTSSLWEPPHSERLLQKPIGWPWF